MTEDREATWCRCRWGYDHDLAVILEHHPDCTEHPAGVTEDRERCPAMYNRDLRCVWDPHPDNKHMTSNRITWFVYEDKEAD